MESRKLLAVAATVGCFVCGATAAFNELSESFDGPTLNPAFDERNGSISWTNGEGHYAPGAMLIDATAGESSVSLLLYSGRGFTAGQVMVSGWFKDPSGGAAAVTIQIDLGTYNASGPFFRDYQYISQSTGWMAPWVADWDNMIYETYPDLGGIANQWGGGTLRDATINWITTNCGGLTDTNVIEVMMKWRFRLTSGMLYMDDWTQTTGTISVRPDTRHSADDGWTRFTVGTQAQFPKSTYYTVSVTNASGRVVATERAFGNVAAAPTGLPAGSYMMKVTSEFGETTSKLTVPR